MRKKMIIILMIAMLAGIVIGSQMLGERLYAQVEKGTVSEEQTEEEQTADNSAAEEQRPGNEADGEGTDEEANVETAGSVKAGSNLPGRGKDKNTESGDKKQEGPLVILDAGHGGFDPGKIGINGALEKDINLVISQKIKKKLEEQGIRAVMTRENENAVADSKVEDLKARVAMINESNPSIAVSIHQNSYSQESIHGSQVFYFTHSKGGEQAAKILQEAMFEVDPDNTRQAKANDTYYLLKKTKGTTVIVECGFLSNQNEANLLVTEEYQDKMAEAVVKGIQKYLSSLTL
nr:N-acetylmuramoyl-L-alanine amidase [uncultured Schaedlerella sp.]